MVEYVDFDRVVNGIVKYLDREIYSGMNDWQKIIARMAVSRFIGNKDQIKAALASNPFVRTFAIMDENGMVDVEGLTDDLKNQIADIGKLEIEIPMFGKFKFTEDDVEKLKSMILPEESY